jgi:hypothetical protein
VGLATLVSRLDAATRRAEAGRRAVPVNVEDTDPGNRALVDAAIIAALIAFVEERLGFKIGNRLRVFELANEFLDRNADSFGPDAVARARVLHFETYGGGG